MNRATRIIVTVVGMMPGVAGMEHGFFGALQGNTPTDGLIVKAIGENLRLWGAEETF